MGNPYTKPYRVGRRQARSILDSTGREVVIFPRGMENWAADYCIYLNNRPEIKQEKPHHMPGKPNQVFVVLYVAFVAAFVVTPVFLYRYFTRKAFYVSGTFLDQRGVRMFFKTTFCTYGNVMPIKSLEQKCAEEFGVDRTVILHFNRIRYGMVKYIDKEMDVKINDFKN